MNDLPRPAMYHGVPADRLPLKTRNRAAELLSCRLMGHKLIRERETYADQMRLERLSGST